MERYLAAQQSRLKAAEGRMVALSPYGVLDRGYALVTGPQGLVTRPDAVGPGDPLLIRLAGGELAATVTDRPEDGDR
jgi:exodeoxyribonuclease VII large subunit